MEKAYFKEKIDSMIPDLIEGIRKECNRLYDSGAIDTSSYENDYVLPKIILTVAIENNARQYTPPDDKKYGREMANIRHF